MTDDMLGEPRGTEETDSTHEGQGDTSPSEPPVLRAFVNERAVSVARGSTALDAVRAADAEDAAQVVAGTRRISDSRGLPIEASTPVHGGAIFRVLPVRASLADPESAADAPNADGAST